MWKSLLVGRELLKEGLSFNVGDGTRISIWHDRWIPSMNFGRRLCKEVQSGLTYVSELIDRGN